MLYPVSAFLFIILVHYFLWRYLPHEFWGNNHILKVSDSLEKVLTWVPYLFGVFALFLALRIALPVLPRMYFIVVPFGLSFVAKSIGVVWARRRLRTKWLRIAFMEWSEGEGDVRVVAHMLGGERTVLRALDAVVIRLAMGPEELTPQVKDELERVYKRVAVRNNKVVVQLAVFPKNLTDLVDACKKLPEKEYLSIWRKSEAVYIELK